MPYSETIEYDPTEMRPLEFIGNQVKDIQKKEANGDIVSLEEKQSIAYKQQDTYRYYERLVKHLEFSIYGLLEKRYFNDILKQQTEKQKYLKN